MTMGLETDCIVEISTKTIIGEEETVTIEVVTETIGPLIGITVRPKIETTTEMVIGTIIGQIIEEMTRNRGMVTGTRIMADPGIETEIEEIGVAPEKVPIPEAVVDPKTDMRIGDRVEMIPEIGTDLNLDPDPLLM